MIARCAGCGRPVKPVQHSHGGKVVAGYCSTACREAARNRPRITP